jgi:nucleoside-diphosphate kinase
MIDWAQWTVILLKPDCLRRGLVDEVLDWIGKHITVLGKRVVYPSEQQIFAHYDDMLPLSAVLGVDVEAELRRIYVGQPAGLALGCGPNAAARIRAQLGDTDPSLAGPDTIRGRYGDDSLARARERGQFIDNLVHTSDHVAAAERDFGIWYGPDEAYLLHQPIPQGGRS